MPTGYTCDVGNGKIKEFEDFALLCARDFGALVSMREIPLDAPIPNEFKPSDYALKEIQKSEDKLKELKSMNKEQRVEFVKSKIKNGMDYAKRQIKKIDEENDRYDAMLEKVKKWKPPSSDHENMKKFMIEQLETSKDNTDYYRDEIKNWQATTDYGEQFEEYIEDAKRDIEYYKKSHREEIERTNDRNKWVRQLRKSLK